mgnify:FL=1
MTIIEIVAVGLIVGILVGLTGMGGALLMTPLLVLFFGFPPTMAIGTDLIYAAITKSAGAWQHARQKTVNWEIVTRLIMGSLPGGILGVLMIPVLKNFLSFSVEELLGHLLGFVFIGMSLIMIIRFFVSQKKESHPPLLRFPLPILGALGGFLVGLTSVGSGTLFMVFLLSSTALSARFLVGTDIVHAFFLTLAAGLIHASLGHVDWSFVSMLLLGSIPGILIGGRLTLRIPETALRMTIICMLLLTGIKMV